MTRNAGRALPRTAVTAALAAVVLGGGPAASAAGAEPPGDGGWKGEGLSLDAEQNRAADTYLARARAAERSISPQVRAAARRSGAELVGFDHRLKSADSLKRKVAGSLREAPGQTAEEALARLNDSIRYTLQWEDARYTWGVASASSTLADWGNDSLKWSNTWSRERAYKGINSAWRSPRSGHPFEVQFHTPASKRAQETTHKLYEEQRLPGTPPDRVRDLQAQQGAVFAAVPVPEGARELRAPATRVPTARATGTRPPGTRVPQAERSERLVQPV
ncbi:ATP nucleotide 3'-pyrophosphokinase [Streptomyces iconiensis]|uniref:ATP nucleotide 3'-pyrophosphokinase n=1 Tax=Streptomyces iconiensis TaxID=1384038 RepID=A0ABT6ZRZ7_9ACTN|nr:ATP nucleotide 3'-pyrophosphokinase [Streptomyces iconiensis]MDJ1131840.1 ATP nucleotide 3'-pyrophosphokinase [Streptomyces iconiensis]